MKAFIIYPTRRNYPATRVTSPALYLGVVLVAPLAPLRCGRVAEKGSNTVNSRNLAVMGGGLALWNCTGECVMGRVFLQFILKFIESHVLTAYLIG